MGRCFIQTIGDGAGWYPILAVLKTVWGNDSGTPSLISQCQIFFYFSEAAVKMLGQGCSLIGFVGGKMPRFDTCNRVAIAMRQLAILLQNTNQPRWILTVIYESTGSNKRLVMCHLAFNMNSFNI
ncbi:MAG: hypothetical protein CMM01_25650 [Rhodopirellula sp.]|nr:hypothetical protein [Rhodopirellula sp.]